LRSALAVQNGGEIVLVLAVERREQFVRIHERLRGWECVSVSTNRTLICVKRFCSTGISMIVIVIICVSVREGDPKGCVVYGRC
jgi:hypothetical protein